MVRVFTGATIVRVADGAVLTDRTFRFGWPGRLVGTTQAMRSVARLAAAGVHCRLLLWERDTIATRVETRVDSDGAVVLHGTDA